MPKGVPRPNRPIEKQIIRLICRRINPQNNSFLRLPPELLQIIFEFAVECNEHGFKCATIISHVSQRMRHIAISTPRLWSYIQCSMHKSESSIMEFWDRTSERVKNIPVEILIQHIADPGSHHLGICRLDKIASINSLTFESRTGRGILEIQSPLFIPPTGPLNHLSLRMEPCDRLDKWDNAIFTWFPPITRLSLYGLPDYFLNDQISFPSVLHLQIDEIGLNLAPFVTCFPNLTFLEVVNVHFMEIDQGPFVIPNLRTLKAQVGGTWIPQLICPNLTTFVTTCIGSGPILGDYMPWISLHPTLTRLESCYIENYEALANACPQLEHLVIQDVGNHFRPDSLLLPRFPALKTLRLHVLPGQLTKHFTLEKFEGVVSSRYLPPSHAMSQLAIGERTLERLDILFGLNKRQSQSPVHIEGTLFQEAKKTSRMLNVWEVHRFGPGYLRCNWLHMSLSWM